MFTEREANIGRIRIQERRLLQDEYQTLMTRLRQLDWQLDQSSVEAAVSVTQLTIRHKQKKLIRHKRQKLIHHKRKKLKQRRLKRNSHVNGNVPMCKEKWFRRLLKC
jgi:hypothetical protein